MKEAFELIKERLETEIESSDKYIREYDSSQVQIAWNKGMRKCLEIVSEVEAEYGNGCEKQTYEICLNGCDDDTTFKMDLTESEYQFLLRVSEIANKTSTYGCMPRMYVEPYKQEEGEQV